MARTYGHKHLSKRDFLTAGATPEMQNAQANAKDNSSELASEALGSVNKQLYDFIAQALQTTLASIMDSGTVEFEKLSQQIYSNIVDIVEGKMKDGDIADAMIENLDIYNGEVKPAEGGTTPTPTTTEEAPTTPTAEPEVVEKTEEKEGETTEVEGETTEVETPPIEVTQPPVEVEALHETIIQEQTHIQPTKEIITQEQPKVEKQIEEKTIIERPEDEHPELPAGFFMDEKEMAELKTKLKLLFIYLRSQKVDIFKIMAGVDENLINIKDKREEIDLDYEEELRYRQNLRKEFNRQVALESAWYEQAFGELDQDEETPPSQEKPKAEKPEPSKKEETPPAEQREPTSSEKKPAAEEPTPQKEQPLQQEPPQEVESKKTAEQEPAEKQEQEKPAEGEEKETPPPSREEPEKEEKKEEKPTEKEEKPAPQPEAKPSKESKPEGEKPEEKKEEGDEEKEAKDAEKNIVTIEGDEKKDEKDKEKKDDKKKKKKAKKPSIISRVIGKILSPLKAPKETELKKKFVFVVVPLGDDFVEGKSGKGMAKLLKKNPLEQKKEEKKEKKDEGEAPKKPPLRQRIRAALQTAKKNIKAAPKNLFKKIKEGIKKKVELFKFKRDRKTKYFKYTTLFRVKNKKELKLWGREFKWKRGTKKIAKDLGVQGDIPPEHQYGKDEKDAKDKKSILDEDEENLTLKQLTPPKLKKSGLFDKLMGGLFKGKHPVPDENLPKEQKDEKLPSPVKKVKAVVKKFVRRRVVKTKAAVRRTWRKVSKKVGRAWTRAKKKVRVFARKLGKKTKAFAKKAGRKVKRIGKKLGLKAKKLGRRAWGKMKRFGKKTWKNLKRFGRKTGKNLKRLGKKALRSAKRVGKKLWKGAKRVGKKMWTGAKRFGKKVWSGAKRIGKKLWGGAKKVGKAIWKGAKRLAKAAVRVVTKIGKAAYKVGKKVVATGYKAVTKAATGAMRGIGAGLKAAGKAVLPIPVAGQILGPILMGLGVGISAASKALKAAFKAAGKAAKAASKVAEKAFASFMKAIDKGKKGAKGVMGQLSGIGGAFKKFGFRGLFSALGKAIKGWTSKFIINGFVKKAMAGVISLGKKGLRLKDLPPKLKAKWGNSKIKKESVAFLKGFYNKGIHAVKGALRTGYSWITSIMNTMGEGMTKMLSTLGERIATIGTVGLKGFLKALFSPAVLVPIAAILLFFFRDQVFGWLKNLGNITFKGIFGAIKRIGSIVWSGLKTVWKIAKGLGGWIWSQSDAKRKWSIGWIMTHGVTALIKFIGSIKRSFLSLVPGGTGSAFMLGMALGGYPWPLYGAMIYGAVKAGMIALGKFLKRVIRSYLGMALWWVPEWPIDIFGRIMRLFGLDDVDPLWKKSRPAGATLDEALTKVEEAGDKVTKLTVNLSAANNINPALKEVGLPDLNKFNKSVTARVKEASETVNKYSAFIKEASLLTDPNKAPGIAPTFYGSPKVTEALLSVFFFKDPLTGQIVSLIPKASIPEVVTGIQNLVLDAYEKNDPHALAQANADVLNYFDYMNRGRNNAVATITMKYTQFIDKLSAAEGDDQRQIAEDFAASMKNGDFTEEALNNVQLDMMAKQGTAKASDMSQKQLDSSSDNVGRSSVTSSGAMKLLKASTSAGSVAELKSKDNKVKKMESFILTAKEAGTDKGGKPEDKLQVDKRKSWLKYESEKNALIKQGKSDAELKALGYGMNYKEWSREYDKNQNKELQKSDKVKGGPEDKDKGPQVVKLEAKVPKIVLPSVQFKSPSKQIKISLPGLTRDIKKGTAEFKLYDLGVQQAKKDKEAKIEAKRIAWNKYEEERNALIKQGKSDAELKALGYGMNYKEWSRKYDAEAAEKEKAEAAAKEQEEKQEGEEEGQEKKAEKSTETGEPLKPPKQKGDFSELIGKMNKLHSDIKFAFDGLTAASVLPDLSIVKGNGKLEPVGGKKKGDDKKKSLKGWLSGLKDRVKKLKDVSGLKKETDLKAVEKSKSVAEMTAEPPKEEDMTVKDNPKEQEELYRKNGISLVSDEQWVSAQEAHKLEEKIITNAKNIRDIIEGLVVMGDNLDNAKLDLRDTLDQIKKNPIGQVVNLPPISKPAPVQIVVPDEQPDYDPLPPL